MKYNILLICALFAIVAAHAQVSEMWGLCSQGGDYYKGTLFKTNVDGDSAMVIYSFLNIVDGKKPYGELIQASNGKLYGMTTYGGAYNKGVLYEYDPGTNNYTKRLDFDGVSKGERPFGRLMQASNGKLYGMTTYGGLHNKGVIFEYSISNNSFTKLHDFIGGSSGGDRPFSGFVQTANGKLYSTTFYGGSSNVGILFEFDITTSTFTKKLSFGGSGNYNGSRPVGTMVLASNGLLYGVTKQGGGNSSGCLYEYNPSNDALSKKVIFSGPTKGRFPRESLVYHGNKLYGTAEIGGANNDGVLYEYDLSTSTFTRLHDFNDSLTGKYPRGSLVMSYNGKIYGVTHNGGLHDKGVLFEYNRTDSLFTKLLDFDGVNGETPRNGMMQCNNGFLYGMTTFGGVDSMGVFFEFNPATSTYHKRMDFGFASEGENPIGSLVQLPNGRFYGITSNGGSDNFGVLFEFDPLSQSYMRLVNFDGASKGKEPCGDLLHASNGKLYGMTTFGGAYGKGVLFEYDPSSAAFATKLHFDSVSNGAYPFGGLYESTNGKLYGTTQNGGTYNNGTLFEFDPNTSTHTIEINFASASSGNLPVGSLIPVGNNKVYGMTKHGGTHNKGVLYEYDLSNGTLSKKVDFDGGLKGELPYGSLCLAGNGLLYGMTYFGGNSNEGVLFEFNPTTSAFAKKVDFDSATVGSYPMGDLIESINGKLYGMTSHGGAENFGVLFEFDPINSTSIKKIDFIGGNGQHPSYGHLIMADICYPDLISLSISSCNSYSVPSGDETYTSVGTYLVYDTLINQCGTDSVLRITLTLNQSTNTTDTYVMCDSLVWIDGTTYYHSNNTASYAMTSISGCDSIIFLDLTLNHSKTSIDSVRACKSYTWIDGLNYTASNNLASYTFNSAAGCDSIVYLNLIIDTVDTRTLVTDPTMASLATNATYQWLDCDNGYTEIPGAQDSLFSAVANGTYAVQLTQNNCTDTSQCMLISTVEVESYSDESAPKVYPNPTNGILTIDSRDCSASDVFIYDLHGKLVFAKEQIFPQKTQLSLGIESGVYVLEIRSKSSVFRYRVVKR